MFFLHMYFRVTSRLNLFKELEPFLKHSIFREHVLCFKKCVYGSIILYNLKYLSGHSNNIYVCFVLFESTRLKDACFCEAERFHLRYAVPIAENTNLR